MRTAIVPYLPLIAVIFAGLLGQVRSLVPTTGRWHTPWGHAVLSVGGALLGAGAEIATKGELTRSAVLMALTGAATAFFSATKPLGTSSAVVGSIIQSKEKGTVDTRLILGIAGVSLGLYGLVSLLTGCTPGADGLRQACTNADTVITSGYQSAIAFDRSAEEKIRAQAPADVMAARAAFESHKQAIGKLLAVLDHAVVDKKNFCDQAWNDGAKLDWPSLLVGIAKVALDVKNAIATIAPVPHSMRFSPYQLARV